VDSSHWDVGARSSWPGPFYVGLDGPTTGKCHFLFPKPRLKSLVRQGVTSPSIPLQIFLKGKCLPHHKCPG
jgi:hypothetical protein